MLPCCAVTIVPELLHLVDGSLRMVLPSVSSTVVLHFHIFGVPLLLPTKFNQSGTARHDARVLVSQEGNERHSNLIIPSASGSNTKGGLTLHVDLSTWWLDKISHWKYCSRLMARRIYATQEGVLPYSADRSPQI